MQIPKISNIVISVARKSSKISTKKNCLTPQIALPLLSMPLVAYSLKGSRDANLTDYCNQTITELKKQLNNGEITQSTYNSHVRDIKKYYENAKKLPADVSSSSIKQREPSFRADDSDYNVYDDSSSDVHTSDGGFTTIEPEHQDVGLGQISAGFGKLQLPEGTEITEQLEQIAGMLDNPILEGVAAELLPGTKFLKPGKDLIDGDYEKAA